MSFAPQQNWPAYHSFVEPKQIENERSRSAMQTHYRYAEIFDHVRKIKSTDERVRSNSQFEDKLAIRKKLLIAWRLVTGPKCE